MGTLLNLMTGFISLTENSLCLVGLKFMTLIVAVNFLPLGFVA